VLAVTAMLSVKLMLWYYSLFGFLRSHIILLYNIVGSLIKILFFKNTVASLISLIICRILLF
jgi:hypothetical protein